MPQDRGRWGIAGALLVGIVLRAWHYLRGPSVWHDEAALLLNALERSFFQLLSGQLSHAEAAPPLFAALTRCAALLGGDSIYALRFPAFFASCVTLFLVAYTTRRLLAPWAAVVAVSMIAVSDRLLWHACEAKPYAFDAFAAASLVALYVATANWTIERRLLAFMAITPVVVWLVFPGGFLMGGVLLAFAAVVWRVRSWSAMVNYTLLTALVVGMFLALVYGPVRAQRCDGMDACWTRHFPDASQPLWSLWWSVYSTFEVARYCSMPLGQALVPFIALGVVAWWRADRLDLCCLALAPLALAFLAAWMHKYPYGGARVIVFAAPGLALLAAAGLSAVPVMAWLAKPGLRLVLLLLVGLPVGHAAWRVVEPWPRADCASPSALVLSQWQPGDVVTADHWEYEFYFRHGPAFISVNDLAHTPGNRAWVILTGMPEADVQDLCRLLDEHWVCQERWDWESTCVLRLQSRGTLPRDRP